MPAQGAPDDLPVPVPVGAGSYASRPPRDQAHRPGVSGKAGWGDASQVFTHMKLYVTDGQTGAIPSTKWWTNLLTQRWSGQLWSYPAMVKAEPSGVGIYFPKTWKLDGNGKKMNLTWASKLLVRGAGFRPVDAEAESWSDWLLTFRMAQSADSFFKVTIGHGLPCTWIETKGVDVRIDVDHPTFFGAATALPATGGALGVQTNGDCYGIFAPDGTKFTMDGASIALHFAGPQTWLVVAVLPAAKDLDLFQKYAAVIPRSTQVDWNVTPEKGEVATTWTLQTENLTGGPERDLIQGWIPHHYNPNRGAQDDFQFNGLTYATPRGELRCATGQKFGITYPFRGLLPELPTPQVTAGQPNPYRADVMKALIDNYTSETGYGSESYWGGKKILLYAKYMEMAHQTGLTADEAIFRGRLHEALTDWFTYEPGKQEHFYEFYPNWGTLVGERSRDNANPGIDYLQDHAFCYGYHLYASALLAAHDPDFARDYGPMARLVGKDYGNWERDDKRFPFFRSLDLWCGHSFSGGLGSEEGNGQESSSEAIQAWGALATLGSALNDKPMRDAGIFAYTLESRAVAEYWFDRDKKNIPRDIWTHSYCSNLQTNGVGWWTWFSGDEYWMHSIQWLPMSPLLKYLAEDPAFAKWDYETMWKDKSIGGWDSNLGREPGVGNVTLSYLQLFDPDQAAQVFDQLWDKNMATAHAKDESGPTYYRIHAGRSLGTIRWDAWTDIPTSTVYRNAAGHDVVAVYNMTDAEVPCHVYDKGALTATIQVPAHRLIAQDLSGPAPTLAADVTVPTPAPVAPTPSGAPVLTSISIDPPIASISDKQTAKFTATGKDQFGHPVPVTAQWSLELPSSGSITTDGLFTPAMAGNFEHSRFGIVATANGIQGHAWAAVEESRRAVKMNLTPNVASVLKIPVGQSVQLAAEVQDQFEARYELPLKWSADGAVSIDSNGLIKTNSPGDGSVTVTAGDLTQHIAVKVVSPDQVNLAAGKPVQASGVDQDSPAENAVDGDPKTRWVSPSSDPQWISVDLGAEYNLKTVSVTWERAAAKTYQVQLSDDGANWKMAQDVTNGHEGEQSFDLGGARARYIKINGTSRTTGYGYSIFEIEAYGTPAN